MELLLSSGLFLTGLLLNKNENEKNQKDLNDPSKLPNENNLDINLVKPYPANYFNNYKSKIYTDSNEFL